MAKQQYDTKVLVASFIDLQGAICAVKCVNRALRASGRGHADGAAPAVTRQGWHQTTGHPVTSFTPPAQPSPSLLRSVRLHGVKVTVMSSP